MAKINKCFFKLVKTVLCGRIFFRFKRCGNRPLEQDSLLQLMDRNLRQCRSDRHVFFGNTGNLFTDFRHGGNSGYGGYNKKPQ